LHAPKKKKRSLPCGARGKKKKKGTPGGGGAATGRSTSCDVPVDGEEKGRGLSFMGKKKKGGQRKGRAPRGCIGCVEKKGPVALQRRREKGKKSGPGGKQGSCRPWEEKRGGTTVSVPFSGGRKGGGGEIKPGGEKGYSMNPLCDGKKKRRRFTFSKEKRGKGKGPRLPP